MRLHLDASVYLVGVAPMSDLVAFYRARLDEVAAAAVTAIRENPLALNLCVHVPPEVQRHNALHDPARVLREVVAGRKLLAAYGEAVNGYAADLGVADALEAVIRDRAAVYRDYPDYDEAWKS